MKQVVSLCVIVLFVIGQSYAAPCDPNSAETTYLTDNSGSFGCANNKSTFSDLDTWVIRPNNGSILLTFDTLFLEYDFDFIHIYDGSDVINFTGYFYDLPSPYVSYSDEVNVTFTTDAVINSSFEISYVALGNPCLYSVVRTIKDTTDITCETLSPVVSSWIVELPYGMAFNYDVTGAEVTVLDGDTPNSPVIVSTTKDGSYGAFYSSQHTIYVTIDATHQQQTLNPAPSQNAPFEFYITKNDPCSGDNSILTSSAGDLSCVNTTGGGKWIFDEATGYSIKFSILDLELDGGDVIQINDGYVTSFNINQQFSTQYAAYITYENEVEVTPNLPSSKSKFDISYQVVANPCTLSTTLHLNDTSAKWGCKSSIAATSHTGAWLITPKNGETINLNVNGYVSEMNVYDGTSNQDGLLESFNSSFYSVNVQSSGPQMYIEFYDNSEMNYDFSMSYTTEPLIDPCTSSQTVERLASKGVIQCSSLPTTNTDPINSKWIINPGRGLITFIFSTFNLEPNYDQLNFYDDNNQLIQSFSSMSTTPKTFHASSNKVTVELIVNPHAGRKRGAPYTFSFFYESESNPCLVSTNERLETISGSIICNQLAKNVYSTWLISPHNGIISYTIPSFSFHYRSYGNFNQFINIYDGTSNNGTLLQSLVPNDSPQSGYSISDSIFIELITFSEYLYSDDHFEIDYTTSGDPCGSNLEIILTNPKGIFGCASGLGNNVQSGWLITPNNSIISLVFLKLDMEDGLDYIEIHDGSSPNDALLGNFTGNVLPVPNAIFSTNYSVLVIVKTDDAIESKGFQIAYTSGLGDPCLSSYNETLTSSIGDFGCPNGIQNGIYSYWLISVPPDESNIVASFSSFSLQLNFDFLYVYDGNSTSAPLVATLTGSTLPNDVVSSGPNLFFLLITDNSIRSQGFYVKYSSVNNDPCQTSQSVTLTANSDSFGCSEGFIANSIVSTWLIAPDNGFIITLSFSVFNLQLGDTISVYDGSSKSSNLLGTFSGTAIPKTLVSSGKFLLVVLTTDALKPSTGFRATYTTNTADPCAKTQQVTIVAPTGTFGCPNGVRNNIHSSWLITPLSNNRIRLTVDFTDLEDNVDFLYIYDGSSESAALLGNLTGSQTAMEFNTTNSVALVVLSTSGSLESGGFVIDFVTSIPPSPSPPPLFSLPPSRTPFEVTLTASITPRAISASSTPNSITPFVQTFSATRSPPALPSFSSAPSASSIPSAAPSFSPSAEPSMTPTATPFVPPSTAPSLPPLYSIVPFSPSTNPSVTSTGLPIKIVTDSAPLIVQLQCRSSGATCCNNFATLWASAEVNNYPNLIDVNSCVYNQGNVTVKFDQYGSNYFTSTQILQSYWADGGCKNQNPLDGTKCLVSTSTLNTNIWGVTYMLVDSTNPSIAPLPSYHYYLPPPSSDASSLSESFFTSFLFVLAAFCYFF